MRSGRSRYALPLNRVRRVLPSVTVFPVPGADPPLRGLAQLGSDPILVLDLEAVVTGKHSQLGFRSYLVLVRVDFAEGSAVIGFSVDEAVGVADVDDGKETASAEHDAAFHVVTTSSGETLHVVDPDRLTIS